MKINYIFRKKNYAFSIETVFANIIKFLPDNVEATEIFVPHNEVNIRSILCNLKHVYLSKSRLNHITGDVHYVSIVTGGKTILTIHDVHSTLRGNKLKQLILKALWFQIPALFVDRITVVSEFTKAELLKVIPFAKNKINVIYNPVNQSIEYQEKMFNHKNPVILHIGTTDNKNIIRLCEALNNIKCKLIVVGKLNIDQFESLKSNKIYFENIFNVSNEEIVALYKKCDIVSFPSLYEGFGMPIIEGNMAGRVVLTSNVCSMPEIANDAAYIVDPYSVESIRKGFLKIINDEKFRLELIDNGFKNISRFTPKAISEKYVKIYQELLSNECL
jgi:glycosyltransferase involved in cell wall biosynthesis